jgi:hypothetical protein
MSSKRRKTAEPANDTKAANKAKWQRRGTKNSKTKLKTLPESNSP